MASQLYNFTIFIYSSLIKVAGFFSEKAKKMTTGRQNIFNELSEKLKNNQKPVAWFHCASLGEFEQGRPVIEAFSEAYPHYLILLTFFSPSGYDIRKNYPKAHVISYLPYDFARNVEQFLAITKPNFAVFVKYEFWYNYLRKLTDLGIPKYLISANFRPDQLFFSNKTQFFKRILFHFDHIFVQNEKSKILLQSIDYQNITIAGDTRFDRVFELSKSKNSLPLIETFKGDSKIFVLGSAWEEDYDFLVPFFNKLPQVFKIIIAPHEINPEKIGNWKTKLTKKAVKYSEIKENLASIYAKDVLFIDNIGMLSSIYKYADYVWIGGSFGKGLHNILEAATFGKPIFFGSNNYQKFQEAVEMVELKAAFAIENLVDFENEFNNLVKNKDLYEQTCQIAKNYVSDNTGATEKIMKMINQNIK